MNLFDSDDYKKHVNQWIAAQPRGGHGQLRKMAEFVNVNSVVMSQIFRGSRHLSLEQAVRVAKFMSLAESERDYFLLLVQRSRAGTKELLEVIDQQLQLLKKSAQTLKNRIRHTSLTDEDRATFYSHWYYSAVRLGISIDGLGSVAAIADHLKMDKKLISAVVDFLLQHGLIVRRGSKIEMGPPVTHIGHDSPHVHRHHTNWRLKALQAMEMTTENDVFYTGPMALSLKSATQIRASIVSLIEKSTKVAVDSKSEILSCLNIDWFRVSK